MSNQQLPPKRILEAVELIWPNFSGTVTPMNTNGDRVVNAILDKPLAEEMFREGWNVKYYESDDEDGSGFYHIKLKIKYRTRDGREMRYPPRINMLRDNDRRIINLTESTVKTLDNHRIISADISIAPFAYDVNGTKGISAYISNAYVMVELDELEERYANWRDEDDEVHV